MAAKGLLIGGEWRTDGPVMPVLDKFTGELAAEVHQAEAQHVDEAVALASDAARRAPLSPRERSEILQRAADLLDARADDLIRDYLTETGFTFTDARTEQARAGETLRLSAQEGLRLTGETIPIQAAAGSERRFAFTLRVPVGVVAAIVPFNAPLNTLMHKVAPALAAGNAVVVKPAEATPLCAINVCDALLEAGLPPEYLALLSGPGESTGRYLVEDRRIRYFTFTGSTAVGLFIKQHSGIAKTHLELGANSATILCADADLDLAATTIARAGFRKAGQVCTSVQRVLVDAAVADDFVSRLQKRVEALRSGDPREADTVVGPMISPAEAARAASWVREACEMGGRLLTGGQHDRSLLRPTLLADTPDEARLMHDEIFAPVVATRRVSGLDEAIEIVNRGAYGLQAGVFTSDVSQAFDAAHRLEMGGVMINDSSSYHADLMPYGGVKDSGYGLEGPRYAVQDMTYPRVVVFNDVVPTGDRS